MHKKAINDQKYNLNPELLAPAGSLEKLKAVLYGDAVYCGGQEFASNCCREFYTSRT